MPRLPFHAIALSMILTALLPAQQTIKVINPPMAGNGGPGGWKVDPGRGDLSFSIPIGTIPGELPIPVAFSMNGTFMSNCVWVLFLPRGMFSAERGG